VTFFK